MKAKIKSFEEIKKISKLSSNNEYEYYCKGLTFYFNNSHENLIPKDRIISCFSHDTTAIDYLCFYNKEINLRFGPEIVEYIIDPDYEIDLSKNQILDPPVLMEDMDGDKVIVLSIDNRRNFPFLSLQYGECCKLKIAREDRFMTRDEALGFIANNKKGMLFNYDNSGWSPFIGILRTGRRTTVLDLYNNWEQIKEKLQYKIVNEKGQTIQEQSYFMVKAC